MSGFSNAAFDVNAFDIDAFDIGEPTTLNGFLVGETLIFNAHSNMSDISNALAIKSIVSIALETETSVL